MGIDDRLDSYYQERTLDIIKRKTFMAKIGDTKEPAGWHTKAKQAIYKDLMELIGEDEPTATKGSKREYLACQDCFEIPEDHARNQLRQELREKVKKYCE